MQSTTEAQQRRAAFHISVDGACYLTLLSIPIGRATPRVLLRKTSRRCDLRNRMEDEAIAGRSEKSYGKLRAGRSFSPATPLRPVFNLRRLHRLPLHIRGIVSATTFERDDVIHNIAFATLGITSLFHEGIAGSRAPLDLSVGAALSEGRFLRPV